MLQNYINTTYIKSITPELDRYLWREQDDYSAVLMQAEEEVELDFINSGRMLKNLRPRLYLRQSGNVITASETSEASLEDTASRKRLVINTVTFSGDAKTITIEGSNDGDSWSAVKLSLDDGSEADHVTITAAGETSALIKRYYSYYRISAEVTNGGFDYEVFLVETLYDLLYAYKFLHKVFANLKNERYNDFAEKYRKLYESLWKDALFYEDKNEDGEISPTEQSRFSIINLIR